MYYDYQMKRIQKKNTKKNWVVDRTNIHTYMIATKKQK
jgi:hypothetical protein